MQELLELFGAFDAHIRTFPGEPAPAELFMIRAVDQGFAIRFLWSGVARELPETVVQERGVTGLLLAASGWAAPMDGVRPARHRARFRVRLLSLVCGEGLVVTSMQADGKERELLPGGEGEVADVLRRCWSRRPDADSYTVSTREM
jgi:hypothetical protein